MTRLYLLLLSLSALTVFFVACGQTSVSANETEEGNSDSQSQTEAGGRHSTHKHSAKEVWVAPTEQEYKEMLSPLEYKVLRKKGTEKAFTGAHLDNHSEGRFHCRACGLPVFDSKTKFDSGTGWPSFWSSIEGGVDSLRDSTLGMVRTELVCARCASHLGHVFADGPPPTGQRYCINSVSIELLPPEDKETTAKEPSK
jgi:peptide-methionine (R)-S-oxide reductase